MALALAAAALVSMVTAQADFTDVSTYRLWPKNGKAAHFGLTNVDSGNAAGDALFGLSNLLLPQLCAIEPSFLWCQNRGSLSGGDQWMVYTSYTVAAKAFGEYAACNPCQSHPNGSSYDAPPKCPPGKPDGTFVCQGYGGGGGGPPPPPQCQSGFDIWHRDCFNGTIFKTLPQATEGDCCAACTAAGTECAAWNMPKGLNGSVCQLMKQPLVQWDNGQAVSECKAAEVDHSSHNCWFTDPEYNVTFAPFCSLKECKCQAIEVQAMGREEGAMCHEGRRRLQHAEPPPPPPHGFWSCTSELEDVCPFDTYRDDPTGCLKCAETNANALKQAGCDETALSHACYGNYEHCFAVFDTLCDREARSSKDTCEACAWTAAHTPVLEAANCTQFFMDYECQGGGGHKSNPWEDYISALGCHLNGTWYSTRAEGECTGSNDDDPNCLWKVGATGRTVNQSCVDGNVIAAVEKIRPTCFAKCPQPSNQTSACYLRCFFDTMVGNHTLKVDAMPPADIVKPFVDSFASDDASKGGCPTITIPDGL